MKLGMDLRRIFRSRELAALCLLAPTVVLLLFSAVFAPTIAASKDLKFTLAVCNQDGSFAANAFVDQYINSQTLRGVGTAYMVDTPEEGLELLEAGDVSVVIVIPAGMVDSVAAGNSQSVEVYSTGAHALETSVIDMTLRSSLLVVSQGQRVFLSAMDVVADHGATAEETSDYLVDSLTKAILQYMSRRSVLGEVGVAAMLDQYLPVEYYTGAVFSLFAALSMLPLIRMTASDAGGPILRRGLLTGRGTVRFFLVRVASGTVFILLVLLTLIPCMGALRWAGSLLGTFSGSLPALLGAMFLLALCFSALAAAIGLWLPREQPAVWLGFYLVFAMAILGGALLPIGTLPEAAAWAGKWLPLRPGMRMLSAALFHMDEGIYFADLKKLLMTAGVLLALGLLGARRRGVAA